MKNVFVEVHSLILSPWVDHSVIIILNVILWHTPLLHVHVGHGVKNSFAQVPFAFADSQQLGLQKRWPIRTCWAGHNHGYPCERTGKKEASPKGSGHATSSRGEGNCRKESEWFSGSGAHPPPPTLPHSTKGPIACITWLLDGCLPWIQKALFGSCNL